MLQSKDYDIHEDVSLEQENYQRIKKHPLIWPWTKFQHHIRFPYRKTKLRQTRTKNQKFTIKLALLLQGCEFLNKNILHTHDWQEKSLPPHLNWVHHLQPLEIVEHLPQAKLSTPNCIKRTNTTQKDVNFIHDDHESSYYLKHKP